MASITLTSSIVGGSVTSVSKQPSTSSHRRGIIMAKASKQVSESVRFKSKEEESSSGRRDLVFAAAAAAVCCSMAKVAMADEAKPGTPEAKKKYAPICVTMPTARICHK